MRLRGAIRTSVDSVSPGHAAVAGRAMAENYMKCRGEVRSAIDPSLAEEFHRMFPEMTTTAGIGLDGAAKFNDARANLGRLDGWLEGQIEYLRYERQLGEESRALAEAKVSAERDKWIRTVQPGKQPQGDE